MNNDIRRCAIVTYGSAGEVATHLIANLQDDGTVFLSGDLQWQRDVMRAISVALNEGRRFLEKLRDAYTLEEGSDYRGRPLFVHLL